MFGALAILVVESGTKIEDPITGETMEVTDKSAVLRGGQAYITQKVYDALKSRAAPVDPGNGGA